MTGEQRIARAGASDGTTTLSWKIVTTANCTYSMPFETGPIAIWNDTVGSPITATVEGMCIGALPLDDEIFLEVEYLGTAGSSRASFVHDGKADLLATAAVQTASSATWGGLPAYATYDGTTTAGVALTDGNLTAARNTASGMAGTRSSMSLNAGKFYFEVTPQVSHSASNAIGIIRSGGTYDDAWNNGTNCAQVSGSGNIFINGSGSGGVNGSFGVGSVCCVAVDLTARLIWFRKNGTEWNNNASNDPASGVGGKALPAGNWAPFVLLSSAGSSTNTYTANFGQSAYAHAVPSGFANWLGAPPFALSTTFTPAQAGWIYARVKCARPSSTFYIDPVVTLT